jgi:hypothetical protein
MGVPGVVPRAPAMGWGQGYIMRRISCLRRIMAKKNYEKPAYEYPIHGINWTGGLGRPTGIYWLDGNSVFAVHGSRAEERVLELGGILIATLRFDPDPCGDILRSGRHVEIVEASELVVV